jgi:hypothetical protein
VAQAAQRLGEVAGGNPFQIEPGHQFLDGLGFPQIRRKNLGSEADALALLIDPLVVHPRLMNLDRPVARLNLPGRMMAVADHQAMAGRIHLLAVALDIVVNFPLDGRLQCPAGAVAQDVIDDRHRCKVHLK